MEMMSTPQLTAQSTAYVVNQNKVMLLSTHKNIYVIGSERENRHNLAAELAVTRRPLPVKVGSSSSLAMYSCVPGQMPQISCAIKVPFLPRGTK